MMGLGVEFINLSP